MGESQGKVKGKRNKKEIRLLIGSFRKPDLFLMRIETDYFFLRFDRVVFFLFERDLMCSSSICRYDCGRCSNRV